MRGIYRASAKLTVEYFYVIYNLPMLEWMHILKKNCMI